MIRFVSTFEGRALILVIVTLAAQSVVAVLLDGPGGRTSPEAETVAIVSAIVTLFLLVSKYALRGSAVADEHRCALRLHAFAAGLAACVAVAALRSPPTRMWSGFAVSAVILLAWVRHWGRRAPRMPGGLSRTQYRWLRHTKSAWVLLPFEPALSAPLMTIFLITYLYYSDRKIVYLRRESTRQYDYGRWILRGAGAHGVVLALSTGSGRPTLEAITDLGTVADFLWGRFKRPEDWHPVVLDWFDRADAIVFDLRGAASGVGILWEREQILGNPAWLAKTLVIISEGDVRADELWREAAILSASLGRQLTGELDARLKQILAGHRTAQSQGTLGSGTEHADAGGNEATDHGAAPKAS